jgi:8-oxo-dGTP pyrophosphatase MutT (NUDIX family)
VDRTTQGDAWAKSVGGPVPRRNGSVTATTIRDQIENPNASWMFRNITGPALERANNALPPGYRMDDIGETRGETNWCRFRRDNHCFFPKELDVQATRVAGYDVWVPVDRGVCQRRRFDTQQECKIAEPGPKSGDPNWKPDATRRWDQGGQRVSVRMSARETPLVVTSREGVEIHDNSHADSAFDPDGGRWTCYCVKHDMLINVDTLDMARYLSHNPDEFCEVHASPDEWEHDGVGWMPKDNTGYRTAAWKDVRDKGVNIRRNGGVHIIANTGLTVTAEVQGEHGLYVCTIARVPGRKQQGLWRCSCKWNQYAWARSEQWKRLEGRQCSHVYALLMEMQSHEMFGGTIEEESGQPMWREMEPILDGPMREADPSPRELALALDNAMGSLHLAMTVTEDHATQERIAQLLEPAGIAHPRRAAARDHKQGARVGRAFPGKVRGRVTTVEVTPAGVVADGQVVNESEVLYPTWDPYIGLEAVGAKTAGGGEAPWLVYRHNSPSDHESYNEVHEVPGGFTVTMWRNNIGYGYSDGGPVSLGAPAQVFTSLDEAIECADGKRKKEWDKPHELECPSCHWGCTRQLLRNEGLASSPCPACGSERGLSAVGSKTAAQIGRFTLTKGTLRDNIEVDGVYIGWIYRDDKDKFWYVRISGAYQGSQYMRMNFQSGQIVVNGERTRGDALEELDRWLGNNEIYLDYCKEHASDSDDFFKSLGSLPSAYSSIIEAALGSTIAGLAITAADDEIELPTEGFEFAGLIIKSYDSGRILMTQRSPFHGDDEKARGKWEFPGGHLEEGETPFEGALREFTEETGLPLPEKWKIVGYHEAGKYLAIVITVDNETWTSDAVLLDFETMGIGWFHPDEVEGSEMVRGEIQAPTSTWCARRARRPLPQPSGSPLAIQSVFGMAVEGIAPITRPVPSGLSMVTGPTPSST